MARCTRGGIYIYICMYIYTCVCTSANAEYHNIYTFHLAERADTLGAQPWRDALEVELVVAREREQAVATE